jgi:predicted small secreted protein
MNKDIDLETVKIANQKYDIERLKRKSINKEKQIIYGELYRGKRIDKRHIKRTGIVIASMVLMLVSSKMANKAEVLDTYDRVLKQEAKNELSYTEAIDFLENHDLSKKQIYDTYIDTLESLDDEDYTFFGDRKDGTHNDTIPTDPNNFVNLSEKEKDTIDVVVENRIEDYKRGK